MNGKRAKELRRAARLLAPDDPAVEYRGQERVNWRTGLRTYQCRAFGQRGIYRRLKSLYKAARRRDETVTQLLARAGLRMHGL